VASLANATVSLDCVKMAQGTVNVNVDVFEN
jgi:hypothetical protein